MTREQCEARLSSLAEKELQWRKFMSFATKAYDSKAKFNIHRSDLKESKIDEERLGWNIPVEVASPHLEKMVRGILKEISEKRTMIETTLAMHIADDDIGG